MVYLAILPWTSANHLPDGDEPHYLLLTHSLAFDLDTDLRNNYEQGDSLRFMERRLKPQFGDPEGRNGELYSRHNMLLPLLLAPFYRIGGLAGALLVMAGLTAATCLLTLAIAHHYAAQHPDEALWAWAILAFTAPLLLFCYQVWVEVPAAMLVLVALLGIHRLRSDDVTAWQRWLGLAGPLVLLPFLKIRFLLIAIPLTVLVVWRAGARARRAAALMMICLLVLIAGTLVFNQLVFQNPLKYHDIDGLRSFAYPTTQYLRGITGLFFDSAFGLFSHSPIWMLLLPAVVLALVRRSRLLIDFAVVFLPYLFMLSPRGEWFGAWSPPFRYGLIMAPLLALLLIPLLAGRRHNGSRFVITVLAVLTAALTVLWLVEPGWTFNLAHGRSHLLDQLSTRLMADVGRFFPSYTRLKAASLVWPPTALVLVSLLWWLIRGRPGRSLALWGVTAALLLPPVVAWAAQTKATRVVEFEDPWLDKSDGTVHPELWVIYRPRFRGGWVLPEGASIRVPIVSGGNRLDLGIDLRLIQGAGEAVVLEVAGVDGQTLERVVLDRLGKWTSMFLSDLPWSQGSDLIFTLRGSQADGRYQAILDRAHLTWK